MVNFISKWVRNRRHQRVKQLPEPPIPTLRGEPTRRLLTATPCSLSGVAHSAFFQRLPVEIRRRILIEAFGERLLHFDLRLLYPPVKKKQLKNAKSPRYPNASIGIIKRDITKPRQWEWCSMVNYNHPIDAWTTGTDQYFNETDHSQGGLSSGDDSWPPERLPNYPIGAMGWLLACRQAYIEGVEVLYGTNRIIICGTPLVKQLPEFLLFERRLKINSVQLYWDVLPCVPCTRPIFKASYQPDPNMFRFREVLKDLPAVLPNLRCLYLSLQGAPHVPTDTTGWDEFGLYATEKILQMVDEMLVRLPLLSHCQIYIPSSYFRALKFKTKREGFTLDHRFSDVPLWRDIARQSKTEQTAADEGVLKGYWIYAGKHDWLHEDDYFPEPVPECV